MTEVQEFLLLLIKGYFLSYLKDKKASFNITNFKSQFFHLFRKAALA